MRAELTAHIAFHVIGKRPNGEPDVGEAIELRPAPFAGYRDLDALRYDYPLVLSADEGPASVRSLSAVIDAVLEEIATGADGDRLRRHAMRLEREIRRLVADGAETSSLTKLMALAAGRLTVGRDELVIDSLKRLSAALKLDGVVVGCNEATPLCVVDHLWKAAGAVKAKEFRALVEPIVAKLTDILAADFARSQEGQSAEKLAASVGATQRDAFDFTIMSQLLAQTSVKGALPASRRRRIRALLATLTSQRFYALSADIQPYAFRFETGAAALAAYQERLPEMVEVVKAIAIAKLEIDGSYHEALHEAFFKDFGTNGLDASDAARFPDYLVFVRSATSDAADNERISSALAMGLPIKALVHIDDLLEPSPLGDGTVAFGARGASLSRAALGCGSIAVAQTAASNLYQFRERLFAAMSYSGPALVSVYSGAPGDATGLPPYLTAAAAMEARAFPAFSYDPSAGTDWASRFSLESNPQPERDWPIQPFAYEDETHQRVSEDLAFTFVDFAACDRRLARHFVEVGRGERSDDLAPAANFIAASPRETFGKAPRLLMVDRQNELQRLVVDAELIAEARRCLESWRGLQELGGVNNSHVARALERERALWRDELAERQAPPAAAPEAPAAEAAPAEAAPERSSDEPYIETSRCTTCNECTQVNDKMFGYNGNKQAMIVNPDAGTYKQLVEAAESCQVSIIHPGKPRNPGEAGLEELIARAQPFL